MENLIDHIKVKGIEYLIQGLGYSIVNNKFVIASDAKVNGDLEVTGKIKLGNVELTSTQLSSLLQLLDTSSTPEDTITIVLGQQGTVTLAETRTRFVLQKLTDLSGESQEKRTALTSAMYSNPYAYKVISKTPVVSDSPSVFKNSEVLYIVSPTENIVAGTQVGVIIESQLNVINYKIVTAVE